MNWKRERPGVYTAGPYRVERLPSRRWQATGPGVNEVREHKDQAQGRCCQVAGDRIAERCALMQLTKPVVGDCVLVHNDSRKDKRGRITAIMQKPSPSQQAIYLIRFNVGGGRTCCCRDEFEVVMP